MNIHRKQLASLFFCSLVPWIVGNGLIPLLPVYATRLGANSAVAGYYLAISYLAITLGALSAGWVSSRFHRHKIPLIISSLVSIPATWLMGQVSSIWGLTVLTAILWYFGGLGLALIGILAGLSAGENERGKVFGTLALAGGFGSLIGGLAIGWLADRWGFTSMFNTLAIFMVLWPLVSSVVEEKHIARPRFENIPKTVSPGLGKSFYFLFSSSIVSSVAGFFVVLIRSLIMDSLNFSPFEISSTGAVGGLIAMPFPFLMGWLSDRVGRKTFLFAGYLASLISLVILAFSEALWQFWVVLALSGIATGAGGIGNALVTDMVPRESLGKGLSIFGSAGWIGGVAGFALAGYVLQNLGFMPALVIGICLVVAALGLLVPVQVVHRVYEETSVIST